MAFRRRFGGRRGGFRRRPVARVEPVWLTTSYGILDNTPDDFAVFQLVGPEDYTMDYDSELQRREHCVIQRMVGSLWIQPAWGLNAANFSDLNWKSLIFTEGDENVENQDGNDPASFNILDPATFVTFLQEHDVMQIHPHKAVVLGQEGGVNSLQWFRHSHQSVVTTEWDITLKRKLTTDKAVWLLVKWLNSNSISSENINTAIRVDSRVLIHDQ